MTQHTGIKIRTSQETSQPESGPRGLIFDIRRFSLHDGPGLRTTVFFKGCPLDCPWCCNPESQAGRPELVWIRERCLGCDLCLAVCPNAALGSAENGERTIDRECCDLCGTCAERCPGEALNLIGRWATVEEVLAEAAKDALYFEVSGGGLTLSGGEPLAQPEFAAELLRRYRQEEKGRHTAVETCGCVDWSAFERVAGDVNLFLYDIKHMDAAEHRRLTGRDNLLILENARRLAASGRSLVIRLPLIEGVNDSRENLDLTADFVLSLPGMRRIDLLPYHRLGEPKYRRLGREYRFHGRPAGAAELTGRAQAILQQRGIEVRVGG